MNMLIDIILLCGMVLASLWAVLSVRLLRSVIALALVSALLAAVMVRFGAGLAAVFELSVCAGLISVIFIAAISFTPPIKQTELSGKRRARWVRFWYLPVSMVIAAVVLVVVFQRPELPLPAQPETLSARAVLWQTRQLDMLGQIAALIAAAFGVVALFKERQK